MVAKAEEQVFRLDGLKWLLVLALVAGGVYGNSFYAAEPILYRALALVAVGIVAILIALQTEKGHAFSNLAKEARTEIRKVVWPTRQEAAQTTMIVVGVVIVMAILLFGLDTLLSWIVELIIG